MPQNGEDTACRSRRTRLGKYSDLQAAGAIPGWAGPRAPEYIPKLHERPFIRLIYQRWYWKWASPGGRAEGEDKMPTVRELRSESYSLMDAVSREADPKIKRVLAAKAFALAQKAQLQSWAEAEDMPGRLANGADKAPAPAAPARPVPGTMGSED